jgi:lipopolysaccharide heptosyltransferase II
MRSVDWNKVKRVLVVRLRSIGDTVLATPSLVSLRRFLPDAEIDILLEDWVAPLLEGLDEVDHVIPVGRSTSSRFRTARQLRSRGYDVAFNLHGGTTGTFFTFASGARHRVGYASFQYSFLYNHLLDERSPAWPGKKAHSAQQQLTLIEHAGVPVDRHERSVLPRNAEAEYGIDTRLSGIGEFALIHPAAAFATKTWATENFARTAEYLNHLGLAAVAVAAPAERVILDALSAAASVPVVTFSDLSLPEITALARRACVFVGNDSGIAHIAAAVDTPTVVVWGSSNLDFWRPWTGAPNEVVSEDFECRPCPGGDCPKFGHPRCIEEVRPAIVFAAVDRVLAETRKRRASPEPAVS